MLTSNSHSWGYRCCANWVFRKARVISTIWCLQFNDNNTSIFHHHSTIWWKSLVASCPRDLRNGNPFHSTVDYQLGVNQCWQVLSNSDIHCFLVKGSQVSVRRKYLGGNWLCGIQKSTKVSAVTKVSSRPSKYNNNLTETTSWAGVQLFS